MSEVVYRITVFVKQSSVSYKTYSHDPKKIVNYWKRNKLASGDDWAIPWDSISAIAWMEK